MTSPDAGDTTQRRQAFLAGVIEHGFAIGLRTATDFLEHFSPTTIMRALSDEPDRRARILQDTIGLRPRIALRKSPTSSGEDLQIALEEGETDAATLLRLFPPADAARFLDAALLWAYVREPSDVAGEPAHAESVRRIREHTAHIIKTAWTQGIVGARDIISAIGVAPLMERLPREDVTTLLERALEDGRQGQPFTDDALLELVPLDSLVDHVPLATLWEWVIGAKIVAPLGLVGDAVARPASVAPREPAPVHEPAPVPVVATAPVVVAEEEPEYEDLTLDEPDELLFDETEAHPDASNDVTVMVDPAGTEPASMLGREERSG